MNSPAESERDREWGVVVRERGWRPSSPKLNSDKELGMVEEGLLKPAVSTCMANGILSQSPDASSSWDTLDIGRGKWRRHGTVGSAMWNVSRKLSRRATNSGNAQPPGNRQRSATTCGDSPGNESPEAIILTSSPEVAGSSSTVVKRGPLTGVSFKISGTSKSKSRSWFSEMKTLSADKKAPLEVTATRYSKRKNSTPPQSPPVYHPSNKSLDLQRWDDDNPMVPVRRTVSSRAANSLSSVVLRVQSPSSINLAQASQKIRERSASFSVATSPPMPGAPMPALSPERSADSAMATSTPVSIPRKRSMTCSASTLDASWESYSSPRLLSQSSGGFGDRSLKGSCSSGAVVATPDVSCTDSLSPPAQPRTSGACTTSGSPNNIDNSSTTSGSPNNIDNSSTTNSVRYGNTSNGSSVFTPDRPLSASRPSLLPTPFALPTAIAHLKTELGGIRDTDYQLIAELVKLRADIQSIHDLQASLESEMACQRTMSLESLSISRGSLGVPGLTQKRAGRSPGGGSRSPRHSRSPSPSGSLCSASSGSIVPVFASVPLTGKPPDVGLPVPKHVQEYFADTSDLSTRINRICTKSLVLLPPLLALSENVLSEDEEEVGNMDEGREAREDLLRVDVPQSIVTPDATQPVSKLLGEEVSSGAAKSPTTRERPSLSFEMAMPQTSTLCVGSAASLKRLSCCSIMEECDPPVDDVDVTSSEEKNNWRKQQAGKKTHGKTFPGCTSLMEDWLHGGRKKFAMSVLPLPPDTPFSAYMSLKKPGDQLRRRSSDITMMRSIASRQEEAAATAASGGVLHDGREGVRVTLSRCDAKDIALQHAQRFGFTNETDITAQVTGGVVDSVRPARTYSADCDRTDPRPPMTRGGALGEVIHKLRRMSSVHVTGVKRAESVQQAPSSRHPSVERLRRTSFTRRPRAESSAQRKMSSTDVGPSSFSYSLREKKRNRSCSTDHGRPREEPIVRRSSPDVSHDIPPRLRSSDGAGTEHRPHAGDSCVSPLGIDHKQSPPPAGTQSSGVSEGGSKRRNYESFRPFRVLSRRKDAKDRSPR